MAAPAQDGEQLHVVGAGELSPGRLAAGRAILSLASLALAAMLLVQVLDRTGTIALGFATWRPLLYAFVLWAMALCVAQAMIRGEMGLRALFVLPAVLFTVAMVIFPMLFGLYIAFTDWNLSAFAGRRFNGLDNFRQMIAGPVLLERAAQHDLVRAGRAGRIRDRVRPGSAAQRADPGAQVLPRRVPDAADAEPGRGQLDDRQVADGEPLRPGGDGSRASSAGQSPAFFTSPEIARLSIMVMDAWTFIPLMMVMLLAGLQALPKEVMEAAEVDGANAWQRFWQVVFPLMMPVSITAIVIRIIFKLKLADIIINVTAGGPGGATDSVTSFIFREYRDRSNVGYGTLLAMVYLVLIIVFVTALLSLVNRRMRRVT